MDYFWRLRVNPGRGADYPVYYRDTIDWSPNVVARQAVKSGDLLDLHEALVDEVVPMTAEEYFEYMWD